LVPQSVKSCGLEPSKVDISEEALRNLIHSYCRESGVRNLQKSIDKIFRKLAYEFVKEPSQDKVTVEKDSLVKYMGNPVFTSDRTYDVNPVGVVSGLAWTAMGLGLLLTIFSPANNLILFLYRGLTSLR